MTSMAADHSRCSKDWRLADPNPATVVVVVNKILYNNIFNTCELTLLMKKNGECRCLQGVSSTTTAVCVTQ